VTLTISNGPSTVKVKKSAQGLVSEATDAPEVVDSTPELAATGRNRSSKATFDRHQQRLKNSWPSGSAVAKLSWSGRGPSADVDELFVASGTSTSALTRGPGWYTDTTKPGAAGNIAIAGHRTGFGAPFADLDRMQLGDSIRLETPDGRVIAYEVAEKLLVQPDATWVLGPDVLRDGSNTVTLTTCDPPGVNTRRLIVIAREIDR
jgi:LPXTG-site transpeptidase (sortase) family protein